MFYVWEKLNARVLELDEFRYREKLAIPAFQSLEDPEGEIGARPALPLTQSPDMKEMSLGEHWRGRDRYLWLAADVVVPKDWQGKKVLGRFDFGKTGGSSGFESLLYVNGQPYQGVDSNHQEVFFEEAAGATLGLCFRLWSGLGGYQSKAIMEHQLKRAELCWLDEAADDLYYTARAALSVARVIHEHSPERQTLLSAVDQAFLLVDWSRPGSDDFYASVSAAAHLLRTTVKELPKHHAVTVRCIGHTHIDVAWLWRLKHTREKAVRSFSTVLRLMEKFPDYVFLQTMPQLYDYIKTDYPEVYEQIKERVKEGRWEAGGGMWLEADCNLTTGESLVRQLLYGTRFLREEFGAECTYLWLPDVFGYSWALPQILRKSGIDTFMTTKISWNQYNRMPHDTFQWRGIDGTEILTHFITTPDPDAGDGGWLYTYNGEVTARSVNGIWETYRDKPVNRELLLAYGYGDGGGGVNREMLELRRRLDELPGIPHVTTGRADEYFAELHKTIAETKEYVHTWDGELYLELHRGTYTSQAYNKLMNRKLELLAREAEWLGVMGSLSQGNWQPYAKQRIDEAWKIVLRNQFHDIIPGSSIKEVYEDSTLEYAEAEKLLQLACDQAEGALIVSTTATGNQTNEMHDSEADSSVYTVWNSAGWERSGLVQVKYDSFLMANQHMEWKDEKGHTLTAQQDADGWWVQLNGVASMGYTTIYAVLRGAAANQETQQAKATAESRDLTGKERMLAASSEVFTSLDNGIETPHYVLAWNEKGQLTSIWDKMAQREVLAEGSNGNVLQVFEDKPKSRHEAWDIDIYYQEKKEEITALTLAAISEIGSLRAVVTFKWTYKASTIVQQMVLYRDSRRIDFVNEVDWHEQRKLLKAAFPVEVRSTEATFDIQYGNVKRPTHWNTSWDYARFEVVGHQWADLSERGYGVSLLNDCKYGYDIKDNVMRLTLIKSAIVPDDQADQGYHAFTYSLLPHTGDWIEGGTVVEAWDLNAPMSSKPGASAGSASLFRLSGGYVHIDAVKKAEDDDRMVLRFHEFGGQRGMIELNSDYTIRSWQECDLMERPISEPSNASVIRLAVKPYEIKTILIDAVKG
ncbi:alpha-mannosidase [Paenibacillus sp. 1_12]|uniref:alpha-mannosidase n=1 Tax=Paenibacillus sp. 1_12 TaxID=1566278 RepID=UPI0008F11200|nr:alpha-mannosidase [Paenibacillus sp. 1_12]SFM19411.1 alpha-mannosidase [Paenibacillus sp. 1_12]